MNQFNHIPTYLVYGDSGSGKSSFIKCLGGVDLNNQTPKTGGLGVAVTTEPGKIYKIQDEILGHIQLIDTRGTWDPGQLNNDEILANLIKTLLDYSVQEMSEASLNMNIIVNPIQQLDGIFYVHNSFIDRYARNTRITQLGLLIGSDLRKSTITLLTRFKEMQATNLKDNFFEWTKQLHSSPQEYIYWDSLSPIDQQKEQLKQLLNLLQPIQLNNIKNANEHIIEIAKQLQQKDLIEVEEQRVRTVEIKYKKEKLKQKSSNTNVTLTCNPPKGLINQIGGWIPVKLPFNLQQGNMTETTIRINADFPQHALPPKLILSCELDKDITEIKGQNIDLVSAEFINNGDNYDAHFKYRWNGGNNENVGRVDLRVKMVIQYRQVKEKIREEKQEYTEKVLKPRYSDEKPYIKLAMEEQFEQLCDTITSNIQKQ